MHLAENKFIRLVVLTLVLGGFLAARINPKTARRLLVRSQYAVMNNSYKSALKHLNKAIQIRPDYDTAYYHRGVVKSTLKDINGAIADFSQAVKHNPGYSSPYFSRGTLYLQYGYQEKALADFNAAIQIDPHFYDALNNKAVLLNTMGQHLQARQIYDSLLLVYERLNHHEKPWRHLTFAAVQSDTAQQYTSLKPRVPRLYFNRSFIKVQLKDLEGALQDLNQALDLNPNDYAAHYQKGEVLVQLKQYKAALQAFERARSLQPTAFYGHLNLGKAYAAAGYTRKAITIFNQAIRRDQKSGEAYFLRGNEKLKQKKIEGAYSDLRVARLLGYSAAADKLKQLDSLHKQSPF